MSKKEVAFNHYCRACTHWSTDEWESPCNECLAQSYNEDSKKPVYYEGTFTFPDTHGYPNILTRLEPYLYSAKYSYLNYDYAKEYYNSHADNIPMQPFGCSSVRNEQFYGRNLDWIYSNMAEFVVSTHNQRNNVLGVAGGFPELTDAFVDGGKFSDLYFVLPFQLYDGINSHGVVANINVVPADYGVNDVKARIESKERICSLMLIRYMLDNFDTAKDAVEYVRDYVDVFFTKATHDIHYETHFMIADEDSTYCMEFVNGQTVVIDITDKPIMTNFHLYDVRFNDNGSVFTPGTQEGSLNAIDYNLITPNGSGLERYNYLNEHREDATTNFKMRMLMQDVYYTRAYATSPRPSVPYWYTEFVGNGLTCASDITAFNNIVEKAGREYSRRSRDTGTTWHTCHSSVYNLYGRTLTLTVQEGTQPRYFVL